MNKIKIFSIVLLCTVAFFSCEKTETTTLTVSNEEILLGPFGLDNTDAAAVFEVNSSGSWKLKHYSWLTPSVTSGESGTTLVSVTASSTKAERIGYITVVSDQSIKESVYITIRQVTEELVSSTLMVAPASIIVDFEGKTSAGSSPTITFSTNRDWTIDDLPDWITADPNSGNAGTNIVVTLTVEDYDKAGERQESFAIIAGYRSESVAVTQLAEEQELTVLPKFIEVKADGMTPEGELPTITISTNKSWTLTGLPEWITASGEEGDAGTVTVTFTIDSNDDVSRSAEFTISAGFLSETVTIEQAKGSMYDNLPYRLVEYYGWTNNNPGGAYDDYQITVATGHYLMTFDLLPSPVQTCDLSFEYQLVSDVSNFTVRAYTSSWGWIYTQTPTLYGSGSIDPNNEGLWKTYSQSMMPAVNHATTPWGTTGNTWLYFSPGVSEIRMLIRDLKVVYLPAE